MNPAADTDANGLPVLWHLKVSHYNEKARWALDYKHIAHVRRAAIPGRHRAIAHRLTGGKTLPVLILAGEAIGDSTRIIATLEQKYPEPPLYPAAPEARKRALEIEDFFDEQLGPYARLLLVNQMLADSELFLGAFFPDLAGAQRLAARASFPRIRRRLIDVFTINDHSVEHARQKVQAACARFRTELQPSGYLVGNNFTIADLTLAALLAPAIGPQQFPYPQPQRGHPLLTPLRDALIDSGALDWTLHMYAHHRSPSAEVTK